MFNEILYTFKILLINSLASPSAGAPALKYGDVNTVTTSPGEVKGLIISSFFCISLVTPTPEQEPNFAHFLPSPLLNEIF